MHRSVSYTHLDVYKRQIEYLETASVPVVIKADGLALGKGVISAETKEAAKTAVMDIMQAKKFGSSGNRIVIEEYLTGPEISVLSLSLIHILLNMHVRRTGFL